VTAKAVFAAMIGGVLSIFSGFAHSETLTFGQNSNPIAISHDISITRVSIKIQGFTVGGFADYCMATWRTEPPAYSPTVGRGGYIEPLCFNVVKTKAAGDWEQHVNLEHTPIYIPAGTMLVCNSLGAVSSMVPAASMPGRCDIEYEPHTPGSPRYRFLRLPYYDQTFDSDTPLVPSFYKAWDREHPLRIASAVIYQGDNYHTSSMKFCLTRLREDMTVLERYCLPPSDQQSPGQMEIGWMVGNGELVGIECSYPSDDAVSSGDCAAYMVVEIPSDLELSAENAFRDYGNVPRHLVEQWCETTAKTIITEAVHNPQLCLGKKGCSYETKMSNCRASFEHSTFPKASCMSTNSCWKEYPAPVAPLLMFVVMPLALISGMFLAEMGPARFRVGVYAVTASAALLIFVWAASPLSGVAD
jgi:hypothetical protein